ncbi:sigma-70 family RNA polymerase sigma factor [Aldersonia sp. NBC_00410]|uniref:RNA polymerase sigma factor n=1 Tax=Aldersonia sp. NBC_00410 TaxID=2975954 RepID=UPI00224FE21C|nr:sigma-70 family RNA polymerase sigma factor [Aldersonia sp. NBC_00410]MCX5043650.1 sigma-70 family RNA polymerase sigma factor [Aldersonia sp. NBC_00410]
MTFPPRTEELLRELAPGVLGALVRRYGHFDAAEDAVQEALLAAAQQWPDQGLPDNPRAWLITVASRRLTDQFRSESARRAREVGAATMDPSARASAPAADENETAGDDTLTLLFLCCHPALTPSSQVALTLRAVGGLATDEIAAAFMAPESTMAQRISRAKQKVRRSGAQFTMPTADELPVRLTAVLHVLYLIFNEGYTATSGDELQRSDLTGEAIRLTRTVRALLPDSGEVAGLLALMLLTDARRDARVRPDGSLVPLDEQDRGRWHADVVVEGVALVTEALRSGVAGPYQIQAAIAALHDEAPTAGETDWAQIEALYGVLERLSPGPMVTLNRAVAVAMVRGPQAGLKLLATLDDDQRLAEHHRLRAVRAHLLEMNGDGAAAAAAYRDAARRTTSAPERRYLEQRARRVDG